MNRRHDIDALRALAFAGVILYHVAMYYVQGWEWHLKSPDAVAWLQGPMRALNLWRMDLVFLISGLALSLLWRGGSRLRLLGQRSVRLLLPLAFGMAVVVPYQPYVEGVAKGLIEPGFGSFLLRYLSGGPWPEAAFRGADVGVTWNHLWYLPYLWLYTTVFVLAVPLLQSAAGRRLHAAFQQLRGWRLLALPVLPLMLYSAVLWPHFPPSQDLVGDGWLHAVYFTLFLYGWWIGLDEGLWGELKRLRHAALGVALVLIALYFLARWLVPLLTPSRLAIRLLADAYLWTAIVAILGWAHHALNRPWPWLAWANESVYPWYVLHQTVIIVWVSWLAPLSLGPAVEAPLLVTGTIASCWSLTAVIRRSRWLRPLFGLKRRAPLPRPSPARRAPPAARSA